MGGAKAQMAISDPPYNVDYGNHGGAPKGGKKRTIQNDDLGEGFYEFQVSACRDLISATDGAVYICMSSPELHTLQRAFCVAGATGLLSLSGPRTPSRWVATTTNSSTSPFSTAGERAPSTTG